MIPMETNNLWNKDFKLRDMLMQKLVSLMIEAEKPRENAIGIW